MTDINVMLTLYTSEQKWSATALLLVHFVSRSVDSSFGLDILYHVCWWSSSDTNGIQAWSPFIYIGQLTKSPASHVEHRDSRKLTYSLPPCDPALLWTHHRDHSIVHHARALCHSVLTALHLSRD